MSAVQYEPIRGDASAPSNRPPYSTEAVAAAMQTILRCVINAADPEAFKACQIAFDGSAERDAERVRVTARLARFEAAFQYIDEVDWAYLHGVLVAAPRHRDDHETLIWLRATRLLREAVAASEQGATPTAPNPVDEARVMTSENGGEA